MYCLCFKKLVESKTVVGRRLLCSQKQTGNPNPMSITLTLDYDFIRSPNSLSLTGAGGEKYIENILRQALDASKVRCFYSVLPLVCLQHIDNNADRGIVFVSVLHCDSLLGGEV